MAAPAAAAAGGAAPALEAGADEENEWPSGERTWSFLGGELTVRAYEDFVAAAIGGVVTAASAELARFAAEAAPPGHWQGRRCLELGAGCGLISSTLLQLGARVTATDLEPFLEHLAWNLGLNAPAGAEAAHCCKALDWGDGAMRDELRAELGEAGADAVFAANCIYDKTVIPAFLDAIQAASGPATLVFMCGVPQPPARSSELESGEGGRQSLLDAFVEAAPERFECHLLAAAPPPATAPAAAAAPPPGAAARAAARHGLPVSALADGVWLLLPAGAAPPAWAPPALRLGGPP